MQLLQFALTGCRDAAGHRELERCRRELELSCAIFSAAKSSEIGHALQQAWNDYAAAASTENDNVMKSRAELYRSLIASIHSEKAFVTTVWNNAEFAPFVGALDLGLCLLAEALSKRDLMRAEIEADHIHNLPSHLIPGHTKSRRYYLDSERKYYLDRIEEHYGERARDEVSNRFGNFWSGMMS